MMLAPFSVMAEFCQYHFRYWQNYASTVFGTGRMMLAPFSVLTIADTQTNLTCPLSRKRNGINLIGLCHWHCSMENCVSSFWMGYGRLPNSPSIAQKRRGESCQPVSCIFTYKISEPLPSMHVVLPQIVICFRVSLNSFGSRLVTNHVLHFE